MLRGRRLAILAGIIFFVGAFHSSGREVPEPPLIVRQQPVHIDELVDIALQNQGEYRKKVDDESLARFSIRGAYGSFLPRVYAGAGYRNNWSPEQRQTYSFLGQTITQNIGGWGHSSYWEIGLSEDLFNGGSRFHQLKAAGLQLENSSLYRERAEEELTYEVKRAAYVLLAAERSLEVAREVLELRRESLRFARTRFENGDVIRLDVMQAEIDVGNAGNNVMNAEQAVRNARESLNLVIGAHLESSFPVQADLEPDLPELDSDKLAVIAGESRPDYRALENMISLQEQNIKIAGSGYLPTASFTAGISGSDQGEKANRFKLLPGEDSRYYGLNLSWNLFDRFQTSVRRQEAVVAKRKAAWDLHLAEQNIESNLRRQWRNLEQLHDQIQVLEKNRELARQQYEMEQERYRLGSSSQLKLRSSEVTFIEAEQNHINKVLDFFMTLAALERDLGRPLEEAAQ